ncbi:MAG: hypothetical protein ABI613_11330 [Gemmatimonadota bacterium]
MIVERVDPAWTNDPVTAHRSPVTFHLSLVTFFYGYDNFQNRGDDVGDLPRGGIWAVQEELRHSGGGWISLRGMMTAIITAPSQATLGELLTWLGVPVLHVQSLRRHVRSSHVGELFQGDPTSLVQYTRCLPLREQQAPRV